jgi:hypothetical protein
MQLEVTHVLVPFLNCLYQFYPKKSHMMLVLMFDPRFKDLFILSNYVKIKKITTATTRYNFETLIPLLCLTYQKNYPFAKHLSNYNPQELTLMIFGARLTQDQITMKHITFLDFPIPYF